MEQQRNCHSFGKDNERIGKIGSRKESHMVKTSVAMATYNGETYIVEQLDSILGQTMPVEEVVICDDCSTDRTVELVEQYIREHHLEKHWRIERNEKNLGYASNFVGAVKKTTGEFIFFCDQDDIWVPDRVEVMVKLMEEKPQIRLLCSEFESFVSSADAPSVPAWEKKQFKRDNSLEHLPFNAHNLFINCQGCSMCVRRSFWEQAIPYWYTGWAHDEFVWKLALCLDGLYVYHGVTLRRRLHSSNVTMHKMRNLPKRVQFLEDLRKSHEATLTFAKSLPMDEGAYKLLERNIHSVGMRIELMRDKKVWNTFPLLFRYADCYHSKKSIPVELYMAIKGNR
mgnify:FL=1